MVVPHDLHNRLIVITGASSGIGAATAVACAQAGMDVVLAARRLDRLEGVAELVRGHGRRALAVACDVCSDDDVARLFERTEAEFGGLYSVFANAGVGLAAAVLDTTDRQMRDIFEANFFGTLRCVREAVPLMRGGDGGGLKGHVLICSSCVSEIGLPKHGAYCATKAAQDCIAQSLRAELGRSGVYVSSVHPITTDTEFFKKTVERSPGDRSRIKSHKVVTQTAQHVARGVVNCLRKPVPEVWPHMATRFGLAVCTAFPRVTAWAMREAMRRG